MKSTTAALLFVLAAPASADVLLTKTVHTDEVQTPAGAQPAKDETQSIWLGKEKVRAEMGPVTYIVRLDQKKLYVLHPAERTYTTLAIPVDIGQYVDASQKQVFEQMKSRLNITATVAPTGETERVKSWSATKYKVQTTTLGRSTDETIWTTKDIEVDWATFWDSQAALRSLQPGSETLITEMRKLDGIAVKADRVTTIGDRRVHSTEELASAERKAAPEGAYDVPKDFTEKPFDPMRDAPMGPGMGGARPARGAPGRPPTGGKPEKGG